MQRGGPAPQFSLAKSHAGFAPQGPYLVTADELADPNDLAIGCEINGVPMQSARTSQMLFPVAALVSYLSQVVSLMPGDVIFTGTPPGVGMGRDPQVWLRPGDVLVSRIEGIGELRQTFTA
jgi:2-keto-4-pentenoate hydratase/2-oxohepta-3-ene-1,7-dioic acid hydratase in catechol pathway